MATASLSRSSRLVALAALVSLAACGSSSGTNDPGSGSNTYQSTASGTLVSSDGGNTVSMTVTDAVVYLAHVQAGDVDLAAFEFVGVYDSTTPSQGEIQVTHPVLASGATMIAEVVSAIGIKGTPTVGTYLSSDVDVCGGIVGGAVEVDGATVSGTSYLAQTASDCDGTSATPSGSWTLTITSARATDGSGSTVTGSWAFYEVHGSLDATMDDDAGDTGTTATAHLTF
jgi:hypothetical protein